MTGSSGGLEPPDKMTIDEDNLPLSQIAQSLRDGSTIGSLSQQTVKDNNTTLNYIDLNNRYLPSDKAPYSVFVEHDEKNLGRLFPVRVGHYLLECKEIASSIIDIKTVGLNRVRVVLKDYRSANQLVGNQVLRSHKLTAFIPKFYTQKKGVLKMVDTILSEDYLLKNIETTHKVMEVRRMTRKITDRNTGKEVSVKRQMIVVSFLGSELPKEVRIDNVNFPVEPFIHPVVQCFSCLRYGHSSRQCKGKRRCKLCGDNHEEGGECTKEKLCVHCNGTNHDSLSRVCPIFKKQKSIKQMMAFKNISFREAEHLINNPSYAKIVSNNRYSLLDNENNFPELPAKDVRAPTSEHKTLTPKIKTKTCYNNDDNSQTNKKRKVYKSPQRQQSSQQQSASRTVVTPNPYRAEFLEYRESLVGYLTEYIKSLINNTTGNLNATQTLGSVDIKRAVSRILYNCDDYESDGPSEKSSY